MKRETINIFRRNSVCSPRVTNTVAPELLLRQKISLPSIKSNPAVFLYCIRTRCLFIAGIITLRSNTFIVILSAIFTAVQRSIRRHAMFAKTFGDWNFLFVAKQFVKRFKFFQCSLVSFNVNHRFLLCNDKWTKKNKKLTFMLFYIIQFIFCKLLYIVKYYIKSLFFNYFFHYYYFITISIY